MTNDPWGEPVNLGPTLNTSYGEGHPDISADGLSLYFSSQRPGGYGNVDIWVTTRATKDDSWGTPVNLGPTVNSSADEGCPSISADGLQLYFSGRRAEFVRPGGYGNTDLWVTTRPTLSDPWGTPVNLGPTVNSSAWDDAPSIEADGLLLFFRSNRLGGYGFGDIWVTTRATKDDDWSAPVNLGPTVNSLVRDESANISADGSTLLFDSDRPGGLGSHDIWQVSIVPILDFNGDGKVDFKDFRKLAQYWGQDEPSCDIGPTPFGDGIVDTQDLIVLAEYLLKEFQPVAHYKLDETEGSIAEDSIGNNDGTLHGNPAWQPDGGKVGGALLLDGVDDYVSTDFVLNPVDGAFSVFAWIKGGAPGQVIISQTDITTGRGTQPGSDWLCADASDGRVMTALMAPQPSLESESVITDDQWHHIGLVYDFNGLLRYLYVDGAEVAKDTNPVGGLPSDGGLYIGAGKTLDAGSLFSGLIDDVRIYDRALSADEVAELGR